MNEKIKDIAEFDGWHKHIELVTPNYLTDLKALHRVALDVMDRLQKVRTEHRQFHIREIICDMFCRPINGQYTDLVDAVYDAIVYLKNHNQCQPK